MRRYKNSGFTLIELMITVAIIGILAAVVVPSYSDYVRRGAVAEGFSTLSDMRVRLEQFYQSNRNYSADDTTCGNDGTANRIDFAPAGAKFTYVCVVTGGNNQTYKITATGSAGAAVGNDYTLDHNNAKTTTQFKGSAVAKTCWLTKGDEC